MGISQFVQIVSEVLNLVDPGLDDSPNVVLHYGPLIHQCEFTNFFIVQSVILLFHTIDDEIHLLLCLATNPSLQLCLLLDWPKSWQPYTAEAISK